MAEFPWIKTYTFTISASPETSLNLAEETTIRLGSNVILRRIVIVTPTGHVGLTGIAFLYAGEHVLPFQADTFLQLDGNTLTFDFDFPVWSGEMIVRTTNLDIHEHTWLVTCQVEDVQLRGSSRPERISGLLLEGGGA